MASMVGHLLERLEVAGVGQFVDIDHGLAGLCDQESHERGADETRAAGDEHRPHYARPCDRLTASGPWIGPASQGCAPQRRFIEVVSGHHNEPIAATATARL